MEKTGVFRLFIFILIASLISCDKKDSEPGNVSDWLDYSDYIPLPEKDAIWINDVYSEEIPDGTIANLFRTVTNQYYINGDTVINNLSYKKVCNKRIIKTKDLSDNTENVDSLMVYSGALRQDYSDKKVFFIFESDANEKLLYDFKVEIGDSVNFYTYRERKGKISCIDSILIRNRYHNVFYVQVGGLLNSYYYMEGIGSSNGLIIEPDESLDGPWSIDFIGFKYKDETININWDVNPDNCFE